MLEHGFAVAAAALFLHALPWPSGWLRRKPLACPVCMTGWVAILDWTGRLLRHLPPPHGWWDPGLMTKLFAVWGVAVVAYRFVHPPEIELP